MNPVFKAARAAWRPPDRRKAWQWAEDNVRVDRTSPFPGKWKSENSPWVRQVMEDFQDNSVESITVQCSAQSAKTQTVLNCALWSISEDPGPSMYVLANDDDSREFVRERFVPSVKACPETRAKLQQNRHAIKKQEINFQLSTFYFVGAHGESGLQSKPIRWLFLDEVRNYPPNALPTVLKRTRAFWNSRTFIITTPKTENDACDREFKKGNQNVWHWQCPSCDNWQTLDFFNLEWDSSEKTRMEGSYDFDELSKSIRYKCPHCKKTFFDHPSIRRHIANKGKFIPMNPKAPKHRRSYTWNALLPMWVSWRSLVEEYLTAKAAAKAGDLDPLKMFYTESLGIPWRENFIEFDDETFLDAARDDYSFNDEWPEETIRFMAADRQEAGGEHYWYVIRAFGGFGKSRLVAYGRAETKNQLEEIRETFGVQPENAMIDTGFRASELYLFCAAKKWKAFKGVKKENFLHRIKTPNGIVKKLLPYEITRVDTMIGQRKKKRQKLKGSTPSSIKLFLMCSDTMKGKLFNAISQTEGNWTIPNKTGRDYVRQLTAEQKQEFKDPRGFSVWRWVQVRKDNHLLDCELMIFTAAIISRTYSLELEMTLTE